MLLALLMSGLAIGAPAGNVPAGMPTKLSVGLFEGDNATWMKNSGVKWDVRYRYLAGFDQSTVNWANGYNASNPRDGSFAMAHMTQSDAQGFIPAFSLYEFYGLPTGWEGQSLSKAQNPTSTLQFFQDVKLLLQRIKEFNKPVLLLMEPDLDAFLQQYSQNNPNAVAAVASTGMAELQGLPNTVAGFHLAVLQLKKSVGADKAIIGLHVSGWATRVDLFHSQEGWNASLPAAVDSVYAFLAPCGLAPNITGLTYDVLVGDPLDRDYDFYRLTRGDPNRKWDMSDTAALNTPSFNRYGEWLRLWNQKSGKRWVLWQIPVGNSQARNVCQNGTAGSGYIDNRPEYFFGANGDAHRRKFVEAGVISMLFGAGDGCGTTHVTDNGYLKTNAGAYIAAGELPLPGAVPAPVVDAGTPVVDAGMPPKPDAGVVVVDAGFICPVCPVCPVVDAGVVVVDAGTPPKPDAGTPYVDAGSPPPANYGDLAQYNFEESTQGWKSDNNATIVAISSDNSWSGRSSLIAVMGNATGTQSLSVSNPVIPRAAVVTFHIFLPSNLSLTSLQPFAQETAATSWKWIADWIPASAVKLGQWNTFTLTMPSVPGTLQTLGIELQLAAPFTGAVFIDTISWGAGTVDAGTPPIPPVDAGTPVVDAGAPKVDAGTVIPPVGSVIKVMPLGDSITAESHGWRCRLSQLIIAGGRNTTFVGSVHDQYDSCASEHDGHGGFTIGDLSSGSTNWLTTYKPDIVVLMGGTNDVAWWTTETGTQVANRMEAFITKIQTTLPGVRIVVQTIPPQSSAIIAPNNVNRQVLVQQYNDRLRILVAARVAAGQLVRLSDTGAVLTLSDLRDGIHPSPQAGIEKIAPTVYNALVQLLP